MIAPLVLAAALSPPDPAPLRTALDSCDRGAFAALTAAEPRRRAAFSAAVYDEQRAIAAERGQLDALPAVSAPPLAGATGPIKAPGGADPAERARATLDARQRRLEDSRQVERAWRESLEESRVAFLAQCTGRRDAERQP